MIASWNYVESNESHHGSTFVDHSYDYSDVGCFGWMNQGDFEATHNNVGWYYHSYEFHLFSNQKLYYIEYKTYGYNHWFDESKHSILGKVSTPWEVSWCLRHHHLYKHALHLLSSLPNNAYIFQIHIHHICRYACWCIHYNHLYHTFLHTHSELLWTVTLKGSWDSRGITVIFVFRRHEGSGDGNWTWVHHQPTSECQVFKDLSNRNGFIEHKPFACKKMKSSL